MGRQRKMPERFVEVQPYPTVNLDSVDVEKATAAAVAAVELLRWPSDTTWCLLGAAVALRVLHAMLLFFGTKRFLKKFKFE